MNPIIQAVESGYSPEDILEYISKSLPSLVPKITKAMNKGYGIKEILGFLAQSTPQSSQNTKGLSEIEIQNRAQQQQGQLVKNGLIASGTAVAGPLGMSMARSALSRSLPRSLANGALSSLQIPSNIAENESHLSGSALEPMSQLPQEKSLPSDALTSSNPRQPPVNQVAENITQPSNIEQPKGISNPKEYLEKKGVLQAVNESLKRGNNPEQVAVELGIKRSGNAKIDPELLANIEEYAKQPKVEENNLEKGPISEIKEQKSPKIEKQSIVSSPNGIGEVKEIRNGKALIDVDGKLHKVKEEDLESSPLPEKDLSELYDELIKGIEGETGEDVSRMVQWAGYNPETNTLQFLPHTGKLYTYGDISEEDAALLRDILSVRKTTGQNFIGAWKAGSKSPIGAALSKLIRKIQSERGGKGSEYEASYEPIYSAYEPAINAKKKKKR